MINAKKMLGKNSIQEPEFDKAYLPLVVYESFLGIDIDTVKILEM